VILLTVFVDILGYGLIFPLLAFIALDLGLDAFMLGILVGSYAAMQFIFAPILGRLSDKIGRKKVIIISVFISIVSFILFSLADLFNSFLILLFSRLLGGAATEIGIAQAYIADITDIENRTKGISRLSATIGAGIIIGPAIGGFLGSISYWVAGTAATILTFINLLLIIFLLPETLDKGKIELNITASKETLFDKFKKAVKDPLISSALGISFAISFGFSAILVVLPLVGDVFFGFGPFEIGIIMMYWAGIGVLTQLFLVVRLEKRFRDELLMAFSIITFIIGLIIIPLVPNLLVFLIVAAVASISIEILDTILSSFVSKRSGSDEQGTMLSIVNSMGSLARISAPIVGGLAYNYALALPFIISAIVLSGASLLNLRIYVKRKNIDEFNLTNKANPV